MSINLKTARGRQALRYGVSLAALAAAAVVMAPAMAAAQDAAATDVDEVVITGVKQALKTSQETKRDADTIVDTITATDMGAFPDKSVAEALQRVPGVTVNRFAASDDTSHFSAEPSGVLIRGLTQVRNEFNGRDTFSANSSRGLGWGDVSPELLQGVDTYKNQTAELVEGGIAGTVNLRTRVPFDSPGRAMALTANVNWGDISKEFTPEISGVFSDRWSTPIGEFGFLANLAYSEVETQSQGVQYGRMAVFDQLYGPQRVYIPSSVAYRDTNYQRERQALALAGQWESLDGNVLLTGQYVRSEYENTWREYGLISYPIDMFALPTDWRYNNTNRPAHAPRPALGTPAFTFSDSGNFQTGVMTVQQTDVSWWGASDADAANVAVNSAGVNMLEPCYSWQPACPINGRAPDLNAVTRLNQNENMTEDLAFNLKWDVTDRLKVNFDLQYVNSEVDNHDIEVGQYSFADLGLDATGGKPKMTLLTPTNINQSPGGLTNPNNYRYNHAMDHLEDSEGQELAFRADAQYLFESDWLDSLKVGVRYADRDQEIRYSTYNWGNIANNWNLGSGQYTYWNIDRHAPNGAFTGYPDGLYDVRHFGGGYFGDSLSGDYVFFNMNELEKHGANALSFNAIGVGQDQWRPVCQRPGETVGCFRDVELTDVSEETSAAYAMLKFGGGETATWGDWKVSGNVGLRYVRTEITSMGSVINPETFSPGTLACGPNGAPGGLPQTIGCYISAEERLFNTTGGATNTVSTTHENWLPSFNLKVDLDDGWVVRFAASIAMSRPDMGLLKNYTNISATLPTVANPNDPAFIRNGAGVVTGVRPYYRAEAYNPTLAPTTAKQVDLSIERYFGDVGSFSLAFFYKDFDDYIQMGTYNREFTINGVTRTVEVTGPFNGEGAKLQGFEVAYQRFFDFLPGLWSGLGVQANYTYVDNQGITNANLKNASGSASGGTPQPGTLGTSLRVDGLEGLSEQSYNLIGLYEKGPLSVRVAYNWRSQYLVTAVDCCVYLPMWAEDSGYLDASVRYRVTDNIELSLQGSNLLNTETVLKQQTDQPEINNGDLRPGSWFTNDRRVVFGVRFKY
ncbi:MAG: TonB-dependent receptor [Caulobacter sp.]|nr:TonB-dependent receptor [Caulobacter sp.]